MSLAPGLPLSSSCVAVIFALFLFSASWLLCSFSCLLRQQLVGSVDLAVNSSLDSCFTVIVLALAI